MKVRAYAIGLAGIALIAIAAVAAARGAPSRQPSVPVGGDAVAHALVVGRDGLQLKAKGIKCTLDASPDPDFEAYDCVGFSM
jgi:hypothetical protein